MKIAFAVVCAFFLMLSVAGSAIVKNFDVKITLPDGHVVTYTNIPARGENNAKNIAWQKLKDSSTIVATRSGTPPPPPPPVDTDGDGVPDSSDVCPTEYGTQPDGCNPPPPPPPSGDTCYSSPGSCGYPDPVYNNVGVPAGTVLTPSGSIVVTQPGTVINAKDVTGSIDITANNVTVQNTRVTGNEDCGPSSCGNSVISIAQGVSGTVIKNVELTSPAGKTIEHAIRFQGTDILIDHVYQHGAIDSLCYCEGTATIADSYSIIDLAIPGDHLENVYVSDQKLTVRHSTFINLQPQTANIFMDSGAGNHLTATNNLFAGGGFTMYVCPKNGCSTASAVVTNNMFARCQTQEYTVPGGLWLCQGGADEYGLFPNGGSFGYQGAMPTNTTWSGNVWTDGAVVPG